MIFSKDFRAAYKRYKFALWFNRGAFVLNISMGCLNLWNHQWWSVPISFGATWASVYCLKMCKGMRAHLLDWAKREILYSVGSTWGESMWGSAGMPDIKRVAPIMKRLN